VQLTSAQMSDHDPYIAASFDGGSLPSDFNLGDGEEYGQFINRKLTPSKQYMVFLRAYTFEPVSMQCFLFAILSRAINSITSRNITV
jgi:hypothetical protein